MGLNSYLFALVGYGFVMHKFGRLALWHIAQESPMPDALVKYVSMNEIKKSLMAVKLVFDFEFPFFDHNFPTKIYIYTFRTMWLGFIVYAVGIAYLFDLNISG